MLYHLKLYEAPSGHPFEMLNCYQDDVGDAITHSRNVVFRSYRPRTKWWELTTTGGKQMFSEIAPR